MDGVKFILLLFGLLLMLSGVSAFSVGSSYWPGNPVQISPGENRIIDFSLQNILGGEDQTIKLSVLEGDNIVKLDKKDYLVPLGTRDLKTPVQISVSRDVPIGKVYPVVLSFDIVSGNGEGGVNLGVGYKVNFDVVVVPNQIKENGVSYLILSILGVLLIIVVIILFLLLRRKK